MHPFTYDIDVSGGPRAAARARQVVRAQLSGRLPRPLLADVALLVTELVANGVHHGGAGRDATLHLRLEGGSPGLHVEVVSPESGLGEVGQREPDLDGGGGLGLRLVERVADRWGVRQGEQTAVWFDVSC